MSERIGCIDNRTMTTLDLRTSGKQSSIFHLNIRSLKPKLDEVNRLMSDNDIHILALSKTWLDENHHIHLKHGRQIIRQDLTNHSATDAIYGRSEHSELTMTCIGTCIVACETQLRMIYEMQRNHITAIVSHWLFQVGRSGRC